jgi:hypothetical protein
MLMGVIVDAVYLVHHIHCMVDGGSLIVGWCPKKKAIGHSEFCSEH